jgi:hypothetical protein
MPRAFTIAAQSSFTRSFSGKRGDEATITAGLTAVEKLRRA